jgi:Protein of unknown function (DUF4238)
MPLREDNHYVPCGYLKRWASSDGRIWTYRILVPRPRIRLWGKYFPKGVAYHRHLYTRVVAGQATDAIERWLASEFETPAEEALRKATSDARLTPDDWKRLVRFLAAQDLRTPARFAEHVRGLNAALPGIFEETRRNVVGILEEAARSRQPLPQSNPVNSDGFPSQIITKREPGQEMRYLVEFVVGRESWLWYIRPALEQHLSVLHRHRWTILLPPKGSAWFTSDDPVIRLNFSSPTAYNFGGGWDSLGTRIFLPLGPQHVLYTQIGNNHPPRRGERMTQAEANLVRRFIAEHAHRMIFAAERDADVPRLRPHIVDADLFQHEQEQWSTWHDQQTAAEQDLMGGAENS